MLKSYFKVGWRNLIKNKGYSLINIGGLATGMAIAILIGLWIHDEISFDKNFTNYERMGLVMQNQTFNGQIGTWGSQAMQLGAELRNAYGSNFEYVVMNTGERWVKLTYDEKSVTKTGNYMEPEVTEMLTLKMLIGSRAGLKDPYSILLSESTAKSMFGGTDPMGKIIRVYDKVDVKVTGVYKDLPGNCSFSYLNFILPWELHVTMEQLVEKRVGWGNSWFQCLVQIADNTEMAQVSANIKDAKLKRVLVEDDDARFKPELFIHPMSKWHLYSEFRNGISIGGAIQYVWMFGLIGVFVLLLACINFMNLSTARSEKRAKEVGIRKAIGSVRSQLINQFFSESLLVAIFAFILSLVIVQLALPWFNEISQKQISVLWSAPEFWLIGFCFAAVTGIIAGSYPALYLSSFRPVKVLKGTFSAGRFASIPRKILVVVQFTVSVTLVIGTIVVFRQIQFAQNRPIGYSVNGLITSWIKSDEVRNHFETLRNELLKTGVVEEVSASQSPITDNYTTNSGFNWKGKDPNMTEEFVSLRVTHEFGKTVGWAIKDGRDFSKDIASDSSGFIINEAAAKYMGLEDPVGETMLWNGNGERKIIGVVKDLISQSPYSQVKQMIFFLDYKRTSVINIKINPAASMQDALEKIKYVFAKYDPGNPFEYQFASEEFAKKFSAEKRIGKLTFVFAGLAILISCLGLFGLASFVAEQRTKEIGIRKILGASTRQLWQLLSKDFVVLVIVACAIAIPISFYFMSEWLMQYEYRTSISWFVFVAAGVGALLITLLTVSFQAMKAAFANPVYSLRSE